jgi:hypothetical protein
LFCATSPGGQRKGELCSSEKALTTSIKDKEPLWYRVMKEKKKERKKKRTTQAVKKHSPH